MKKKLQKEHTLTYTHFFGNFSFSPLFLLQFFFDYEFCPIVNVVVIKATLDC